MENLSRFTGFNDFSLIHHGDAVRDVVDDAEVVRNENHRKTEVLLKLFDEIENLRLDRDIQRGDRFIRDDELGFWRERPGDGDALALATRKLVRIFPHHPRIQADGGHQGLHAVEEGIALQLGMALADGLGEGRKNGHPRVERGVRVLENHLEIQPPLPDFRCRKSGQVFPIQNDGAGARRDELHDRAGKSRFPTAGLAHQTEDFTLFQTKRHAVHRADYVFTRGKNCPGALSEMGVEVFDFQVGHEADVA